MESPPFHKFPVFSIVEDDDRVKPKLAQCPNCGAVHKVTDVTRSEIVNGRDDLTSVITKGEIARQLPEGLAAVLDANECDMSIWENVKFIIDNAQWGSIVVLRSESVDGLRCGKYVKILGEKLYRVDEFSREEYARRM